MPEDARRAQSDAPGTLGPSRRDEEAAPRAEPAPARVDDFTFFESSPVEGLRRALGRFVHGLAPGPDGPERPIPVFLQLLDAETFRLDFRAGDARHDALADDQRRFVLPRGLPPLVGVLAPFDDGNPTSGHVLARHAYTEGAYLLLDDLIRGGSKLTLREFVRFARDLADILVFLHERDIPCGQWNPESILAVAGERTSSPFDGACAYRFDVLNSGVRFVDSRAIPEEWIRRGYFAPELTPFGASRPDESLTDLESDIFGFCAFLKDVFERATSCEELTRQATRVRDHYYREQLRERNDPGRDACRDKEQEILDHLYTLRIRIESAIATGLRERGDRPGAAALGEAIREADDKLQEYIRLLDERGFAPADVFGADLKRYVPYQIQLEPQVVNSFEDTEVRIRGRDLPGDVVRVSLGEHEPPLEVVAASTQGVRFIAPAGFPAGEHAVLINNRRTDRALRIVTPQWSHIEPATARKPWPGFGDVQIRVFGERLPREARFALAPIRFDSQPAPASRPAGPAGEGDERQDARRPRAARKVEPLQPSQVEGGASSPTEQGGNASDRGEEGDAPREGFEVRFAPMIETGTHSLLCNDFDTGLELVVADALPEPVVSSLGPESERLLNHREQRLSLRGHHFHPDMRVDLGEGAPQETRLELDEDSSSHAYLTVPRGYPSGEYRLRVNHRDTEHTLRVVQPSWDELEPARLRLQRGDNEAPRVVVRGRSLPPICRETGDVYSLCGLRGKELEGAVVACEERPVPTSDSAFEHVLTLSPNLARGRLNLRFAGTDTGLRLAVARPLSFLAIAATAAACLIVAALLLGWVLEAARPSIGSLEATRVYNFGPDGVRVEGERLTSVRLRAVEGDSEHDVALEGLDADGSGGQLRPAGVPAGIYDVLPRRGWLTGEPFGEPLTVVSPRFALRPRRLHRLEATTVQLVSEAGLPMESVRYVILRPLTETGEPRPLSAPADGTPLDALRWKFPLRSDGSFAVPRARFEATEEGRFAVYLAENVDADSLRAERLRATAMADEQPGDLTVVGPRVQGVLTKNVVLDQEGVARIELAGEAFPGDLPLALLDDSGAIEPGDAAAALLERSGDSEKIYEGEVAAGSYRLAWDWTPSARAAASRGATRERIEAARVVVEPAPRIDAVEPAQIEAGDEVLLTLRGVNLGEVDRVVFARPPSAAGTTNGSGTKDDAATNGADPSAPISPQAVRELDGDRSEVMLAAPALDPGRYSLRPGAVATLEVHESCRRVFDRFLEDRASLNDLLDCVARGRTAAPLREEIATTFFDRGHFRAAREVYDTLTSPRARFRVTLVERTILGQPESVLEFAAGDPNTADANANPYVQAARALGWVRGTTTAPSSFIASTNGTWDLDYAEGIVTADPRRAVDAFERSISRKSAAAGGSEVAPFRPALTGRATARLEVALAVLASGDAATAFDLLARHFDAADGELAYLLDEHRALAALLLGHLFIWTRGDSAAAAERFARAAEVGAANSPHAVLAGSYAKSLSGGLDTVLDAANATGSSSVAGSAGRDGRAAWLESFITAFGLYRVVRDGPNFNIVTEPQASAASLSAAERRASRALHEALTALEEAEAPVDPLARDALLFYVRSAQSAAWPRQPGGRAAAQVAQRLEAGGVNGAATDATDRLRDFYLLEGQLGPLEPAQLGLLPQRTVYSWRDRARRLAQSDLPEGLATRLRRWQRRLGLQ